MARPIQLHRRILLAEALILLAVVLYYEAGTFLFRADPSQAHEAALRLWNMEQSLGLDIEPYFQAAFSQLPLLLDFLIFVYVGPHFFLTLGFLVWAYWYRFSSYPHVRDAMVTFTFLAFGFQWLVPVSPPRLVPESGLLDSIDQTLPVSGNTDWVQTFSNAYAALPSVHFGWSLLVALLAIRLSTSRHRYWWYVYPALIGLSILATGNHWTLDLVLSVLFIGLTETGLAAAIRREWVRFSTHPTKVLAPTTEAAEGK